MSAESSENNENNGILPTITKDTLCAFVVNLNLRFLHPGAGILRFLR